MPLSRRRLLRAGLAGGAGLAAAGWAPTRGLLAAGRDVPTTRVDVARVRLDGEFRRLVGAFDTTEHVHDGMVEVLLWPGDRTRLDATGASYDVVVEDWHRHFLEERRQELRLADALGGGRQRRDGHEGRVDYRTYGDYLAELDAIADANPAIARRVTLTPESWEGRPIEGLLIGADIQRADVDGRPQAIVTGVHHAREWPSGEFTMNLAHDLVRGHADGDERIRPLVEGLATWVLPICNPDGFLRSREWIPVAQQQSLLWSTGADAALIVYEDGPGKRRNLRDNGGGTGPLRNDIGIDTNRNYPVMWGGIGSSDQTTNQTYHGPAPASEPEVRAMLSLLRRNQVIAGISNHTSGNLMLRPWGYTPEDAPDEGLLTDLGARMADDIGYTNGSWNEALYPGTGIWDDYLYGVQGTLAYTMEHFTTAETGNAIPFHPVYAAFVPEKYASVLPSYLAMLEAALDPATHVVLRGAAPAGTVLHLRKAVEHQYSRPDPETGEEYPTEVTEATCVVGADGRFAWHVNPSASRFLLHEYGEQGAPYVVTATRPDGATTTVEVTGERGDVVDLTV